MNGLYVMVAGMIAIAVANEEVIAEPDAPAKGAIALFLGAGSLLFLASYAWYMQVITGRWATIHAIGLVILALTAAVSFFMPAYGALLAMSAALILVAVLDQRRSR
jgi:low temperature requirement protein LtrA